MAALQNKNVVDNLNNLNERKNFICGVVEGFYGRPWTPEQRKDLFGKQQKWGMNCYLYAPKDDYKHRAYWRELYTVEEAEHLTALISEAKHHNITFYYAISPGLDVTYSSQKEVSALKRKLEQVQQLGCNAFAILFDDIDPEMSGADKEVFQSFAHAQVSVTNEIYTHLGQPKFMFCPTQYCSTRALPNIQTSEYLTTLGAKLAPEIDIMWTGTKVITKILTVEHIREVTEVLKRPPVIWDNLHANDYDQARLFLGPYCGRSPDLIRLLRGVVTNPNCEYGPNFIAIHTLGQWSRSSTETNCDNDAVSADIKLETEGDDGTDDYPTGLSPSTYHPRRALRLALIEWLDEFDRPVDAFGPIRQPQIPTPVPILPSVNTCMSVTITTPATPGIPPNINLVVEAIQDASFNPPMNPVMNSLISENKVVLNSLPDESETSSTVSQDTSVNSGMEPMDCNPTPNSSPPHNEDSMVVEKVVDGQLEQVEDAPRIETCASTDDNSTSNSHIKSSLILPIETSITFNEDKEDLTVDDLQLLADLFYLPFEHGKQGGNILSEFNWLKMNSVLVVGQVKCSNEVLKPEVQEWYDRATKFEEMTKSVKKMANRLYKVRNRSLLYDLYPYVWDMRGVISLLNSYVSWLALGQVSPLVSNFVHGNYTWFSKGWREAFMSGDQEPWVFRGGLTAELQRLIPVDASNDLFVYKTPEIPLNRTFTIRPFLPDDRNNLYSLVLKVASAEVDATQLYSAHPNLRGEMLVGSYLDGSKDRIVMLAEDDSDELVGYCVATSNATEHVTKLNTHFQELREKYPKVTPFEGNVLTPCEELLAILSRDPEPLPEGLVTSYPATLNLCVLSNLLDDSIPKRLLTCVFASLRAQGIFGIHVAINTNENIQYDFYSRLGFLEIKRHDNLIYLGRSF